MRGREVRRLAPVEVVFELRPLLFLAGDDLGADHAFGDVELAQARARRGIVAHPLGEDVARAGEGRGGIGHFLRGIDDRRAAAAGGSSAGSCAQSSSASGSRPRSRAMIARVRFFGR